MLGSHIAKKSDSCFLDTKRQSIQSKKPQKSKPSERIYRFALLLSFLEGNAYSLLATEHQE
jgi:hypothetical protein